MFKAWKYVRWGALVITLVAEAAVFWFAHGGTFLEKVASASSWTWLGWTSFTFAWLFFEMSIHLFRNGRRIRSELDEEGNEEITYETGLHWLVLRKNIRDHRAAWYFIWVPVWLATFTFLYFVGWVAYLVASVPALLSAACASAQAAIDRAFVDGFSFLAKPFDLLLEAIPGVLSLFHYYARYDTLVTFGVLAAAWIVMRIAEIISRRIGLPRIVIRLAHLAQWFMVTASIFALLATSGFDWLTPVYTFLPHSGPVAMGFFPLTFSIPFFIPHIAEWLSERYALITDKLSLDAVLLMCKGIFDYDKERVSLERVVDTKIHLRWWQRVLGVGDISLVETGGHEDKVIPNIWGPRELDRALDRAIRKRRRHTTGTTD